MSDDLWSIMVNIATETKICKTLTDCLYVPWTQIITKLFLHSCIKLQCFFIKKNYQMCLGQLKVRQNQIFFFKQTFPPKNKQTNSILILWDLLSRHQKDISKLTDPYFYWKILYNVNIKSPKPNYYWSRHINRRQGPR